MTANLIQIGNSWGIRIPKKIVEQFELKTISLEILQDGIFLIPIKPNDIRDWDTPELRKTAKKEKQEAFEGIDLNDKEWRW